MIFISIGIKSLIFKIYLGQEKKEYESISNSSEIINLKLYKNGKFYSFTYDMSCQTENIGTYSLGKETLDLKFENKKSKYLGTHYLIKDEILKCLNCQNDQELKIKNM